ncbi:hypothetical protein BDA99DRAFT_508783 [Phascolomyces articulosus]|uniref:Uncharacterized protein n=1 Tax=Phascolomyces articulosus TaxID=60185 RepID=A0AAD5PEA7_9FUNG|nr:hypothetical protein BDA99DRAFT_508783 [Phascolomyces articulosus]
MIFAVTIDFFLIFIVRIYACFVYYVTTSDYSLFFYVWTTGITWIFGCGCIWIQLDCLKSLFT